MSSPFEDLTNLDRLVHEPARLAILTALDACRHADFMYLQSLTGLANGNLSQHLSKLEAGGLVAITRAFAGKTPKTVVRLTPDGRSAIRAYWRKLEQTRREAHNRMAPWRRALLEKT